jgi:16S rRNA (cytosine967-C5)-methyltransferase
MNRAGQGTQPAVAYLRSPRTPHLLRLWAELCTFEELPQLDRWLAQRFRQDKRFGKKDRLWYSDALFMAFRFGVWAWAAESLLGAQPRSGDRFPQAADWGSMDDPRITQGASWAELRQMSGDRLFYWLSLRLDPSTDHDAETIQSLQAWRECALQEPLAPAALLWWGLPPAYRQSLEQRQTISQWRKSDVLLFLERQGERAPLWLRLNASDRLAAVQQELSERGLTAQQEGPSTLRVGGDGGILGLEAYQQGWIEIQDRASQQIGEAIPLHINDKVWDACAGGGGKTMQIAARLGSKGRVYASDVRQYKLADIRLRAERARFKQVRFLAWNGQELPPFDAAIQEQGGFDVVLVDAPCTSSGTWRRNAEARLRLAAGEDQKFAALQASILEQVSRAVRVGGYLVYGTCSWLVSENEAQIEGFLADHSNFVQVSQRLLGCPQEDSDTMFVAVMQRKA